MSLLKDRKTSKKKEKEAAEAKANATDVMDMPFEQEEVLPESPPEPVSTEKEPEAEGTETVHVQGITAFGLYRFDEAQGARVRTERFESAWTRGGDILSLEAFATDEERFALTAGGGSAWYDAWRAYWYRAEGAENCRIGYRVSFRLNSGEVIDATLLKPGDELSYRPYLENYLYADAANAYAGWYSHLEPADGTGETLLTSIKFTPGERVGEIDGEITVTAFVYDSDNDFAPDGTYRGDVFFTATLVNR